MSPKNEAKKSVTELFDDLFGEDYDSLRNLECIFEEYSTKKKLLLITVYT